MPDLAAMLESLTALHPRRIDLSLGRVERLLEAMGRPQDKMPPVIHVAGTNGKGSTIAFLRAMLEAAGKTCHVYTSPHLVRFNERIRLGRLGGGALVDDAALVKAIVAARRANGEEPITFFEITTAIAFRLFADNPADFTLLEVGLGGRFDATNVIAAPLAAVIAPVSLDHAEFLGEDLAGVAAEKAGILKRDRPGIIGPQDENALAMIAVEAAAVGATLFKHGEDFSAHGESGRLIYQDEAGLLDLPLPRLSGRHQIDNAGLAIAALRRAGIDVPQAAIATGLTGVEWPARMQRLRDGPLVALAPEGSEVWLDGGHNPAAGEVVAAAMAELEERVPRPLVLIAGMLTTKDPAGYFQHFAGLALHAMTVPVPDSDAGFSAEALAQFAMEADVPAKAYPDVATALRAASTAGDGAPRILICGSLYLAGSVLRENGPLPA